MLGEIRLRMLPALQHTDRRFTLRTRGVEFGIRNNWITRITRSESILR